MTILKTCYRSWAVDKGLIGLFSPLVPFLALLLVWGPSPKAAPLTSDSLTSGELVGVLVGEVVTEKVGAFKVESRTVSCLSLELEGGEGDKFRGQGYLGAMELSRDQVVRTADISCSFGEESVGELRFNEEYALPFRIVGPVEVTGSWLTNGMLKLELGEELSLFVEPWQDFFGGFFQGNLKAAPQIAPSGLEEAKEKVKKEKEGAKKEAEEGKKDRESAKEEREREKEEAKKEAEEGKKERESAKEEASTAAEDGSEVKSAPDSTGRGEEDGTDNVREEDGPSLVASEILQFDKEMEDLSVEYPWGNQGDGSVFLWLPEAEEESGQG